MKFYIDNKIVTTDEMPLVVVLSDQDKQNIANMDPDCNVYCMYEKDKHSTEEMRTLLSKAKKDAG